MLSINIWSFHIVDYFEDISQIWGLAKIFMKESKTLFSSNLYCVKYATILFSQARIFPYKDEIYDSVHIWENTDQRKPVFCHILRSVGGDVSLFC